MSKRIWRALCPILILIFFSFISVQAFADTANGCAAIGARAFSFTSTTMRFFNASFNKGDRITLIVSGTPELQVYKSNNQVVMNVQAPGYYVYTVSDPAGEALAFEANTNSSLTVNANCIAGFFDVLNISQPAQSLAQQNTNALQFLSAEIEYRSTSYAYNEILDDVIAHSQGNDARPITSNQNGATVFLDAPQTAQVVPTADAVSLKPEWQMWMGARGSALTSGTMTGGQAESLFGFTHRLGDNAVAGLFGGGETFNYADPVLGAFTGNGFSAGGYMAGKFANGVRLDARAYGSVLNDNFSNNGVSGSTTAQRLTASISASDEFAAGDFKIEPFIRATGMLEWQGAFTDSSGAAQSGQNFTEAIVSPGVKIARAFSLQNGSVLNPHASLEADYAFASNQVFGFANTQGLSGKVSAGLDWNSGKGTNVSLSASHYGIGSAVEVSTIQATVAIKF